MFSAIHAALVFTVVLLAITAYFLMGGTPLLILKHDVALDARFVRGFFNVYYRTAFWAALAAALSYALAGRPVFAVGVSLVALVAVALRHLLLPAMDRLGERITANDGGAVRHFRRMHAAALAVNLAQLLALLWSTSYLSLAPA